MESYKDTKTGAIIVKGEAFSVTVCPDGRVIAEGRARIEEPPTLPVRDTPSPRSRQRADRKRGSR